MRLPPEGSLSCWPSAIRPTTAGKLAELDENQAVDDKLADFQADLVIRPKDSDARTGALYFATSNDKLNEALLCQMEADRLQRNDIKPIALVETPEMRNLSGPKIQRAQNRSLSMAIFRGDEDAAMDRIRRDLGIAA